MKKTDKPVVVEHLFNKTIDEVWNAITELDQMTQWFFDNIPDYKPEVGFKTQFNVQAPSRDFLHIWEVVEVIPKNKIVTNWKYKDIEGNSFVTFELSEINNQTKLTVTTKVINDFDDTIPEFKRESCVGGWNYFIKDRLKDFLSI